MCQMFEFSLFSGVSSIEDTMELPSRQMRDLGYKIQNILIDDRMDGSASSRAQDALRVSLRLGESAIVLGEVRGEEVSTLYQSMRTGSAGSSIMGTMHGSSAKGIYERVVHDMGIAPEAFMATDFLVTMGTCKERGSLKESRKIAEFVSTGTNPGEFVDLSSNILDSPAVARIAASTGMTESEINEEIGIRAEMRKFISTMAMIHGEQYFGAKWILLANDYLAQQLSSGNTDRMLILEGFKKKFRDVSGLE